MATVTKVAPVGNPKSLSEQIQDIENSYSGCPTVDDIQSEIAKKERDRDFASNPFAAGRLAAEVNKCRIALKIAECYQAAITLLKSQFLADQIKQDRDFVLSEIETALVEASVPFPVDAPSGSVNFDKPEVTLPREISIEITGDTLPTQAGFDGCSVTLERIEGDQAFYSVQSS